MTVLENVLVPILNRETPVGGIAAAQGVAMDLLERVGIAHLAVAEARAVNLFHRKKIELARALGAGANCSSSTRSWRVWMSSQMLQSALGAH